MYDDRQYLEHFNGPGRCLFRGCLPSGVFHDPPRFRVTPTSIDPVVATLFACRYRMEGPAVVLFAMKSDFAELLDGPKWAGFAHELAVNLALPPDEFESRCFLTIPVQKSVDVLDGLGYHLPAKLPDLGALTRALMLSAKMHVEDIECYIELCQQSTKGG